MSGVHRPTNDPDSLAGQWLRFFKSRSASACLHLMRQRPLRLLGSFIRIPSPTSPTESGFVFSIQRNITQTCAKSPYSFDFSTTDDGQTLAPLAMSCRAIQMVAE